MGSNITFSVVFYQRFGLDINVVTKTVNMNTATLNNNNNSILSGSNLTGGSGIVYHSTTSTNISTGSWVYNSPTIEPEKLILYIDLMTQLLGIDMNFKKFSEMTSEEIKSFTRDLKLKKLID